MTRTLCKRARDFLGCYLPLPWYYGREFRQIGRFFEQSNRWSRAQLEEHKLLRLRELVDPATQGVNLISTDASQGMI